MTFEDFKNWPLDCIKYEFNQYVEKNHLSKHIFGEKKYEDQALASAVFKICGWAVKSIEEIKDAFNKGMDIEFNIGTGVMGNVINIIYSPNNKRFEEPLFDFQTLVKLGYGMNDIILTLGGIAATEELHYKAFECVNR